MGPKVVVLLNKSQLLTEYFKSHNSLNKHISLRHLKSHSSLNKRISWRYTAPQFKRHNTMRYESVQNKLHKLFIKYA